MPYNPQLSALQQVTADACCWSQPKLTLDDTKGKDCIHHVKATKTWLFLIWTIVQLSLEPDCLRYWTPAAVPPYTLGYLVGLYPMFSIFHIDQGTHPLFWNLTHIFSQIYIYDGDTDHLHLVMGLDHSQLKWADPILVPLLLGAGITGCAAQITLVLVLVLQDQGFRTLSKQVKQDLVYLEKLSLHTGVSGWLASRGSL